MSRSATASSTAAATITAEQMTITARLLPPSRWTPAPRSSRSGREPVSPSGAAYGTASPKRGFTPGPKRDEVSDTAQSPSSPVQPTRWPHNGAAPARGRVRGSATWESGNTFSSPPVAFGTTGQQASGSGAPQPVAVQPPGDLARCPSGWFPVARPPEWPGGSRVHLRGPLASRLTPREHTSWQ